MCYGRKKNCKICMPCKLLCFVHVKGKCLHFVLNAVFALTGECRRHLTHFAWFIDKAFGLFVKCSHHKDFVLFLSTLSSGQWDATNVKVRCCRLLINLLSLFIFKNIYSPIIIIIQIPIFYYDIKLKFNIYISF